METKYPFVCGKLWEDRGRVKMCEGLSGAALLPGGRAGSGPGAVLGNKRPPATAQQAGDRGRAADIMLSDSAEGGLRRRSHSNPAHPTDQVLMAS